MSDASGTKRRPSAFLPDASGKKPAPSGKLPEGAGIFPEGAGFEAHYFLPFGRTSRPKARRSWQIARTSGKKARPQDEKWRKVDAFCQNRPAFCQGRAAFCQSRAAFCQSRAAFCQPMRPRASNSRETLINPEFAKPDLDRHRGMNCKTSPRHSARSRGMTVRGASRPLYAMALHEAVYGCNKSGFPKRVFSKHP